MDKTETVEFWVEYYQEYSANTLNKAIERCNNEIKRASTIREAINQIIESRKKNAKA